MRGGRSLGKRPNGYLGFGFDLSPHLDFAGENVLAVRVDNSLQPSSRWYTGPDRDSSSSLLVGFDTRASRPHGSDVLSLHFIQPLRAFRLGTC